MVLTEFNEEVFVSSIRQEGRQEGLQEGRQETLEKNARRMINMGKFSMQDIAEGLNMPVETIEKIAGAMKKENIAGD